MQQLRWILLLLVLAIVLPTVCLLWFMGQAVSNERLVVRQKLINSYRIVLSDQLKHVEQRWGEIISTFGVEQDLSPRMQLDRLATEDLADGLLVYKAGRCAYPVQAVEEQSVETSGLSSAFLQASQAEFVKGDLKQAMAGYEQIVSGAQNEVERLQAIAALGRCRIKVNRRDEAIELLAHTLKDSNADCSLEVIRLRFNLRLSWAQLQEQSETLLRLAEWVAEPDRFPASFPSAIRLSFLQRVLTKMEQRNNPLLQSERLRIQRVTAALERSINLNPTAISLPEPGTLFSLPDETGILGYVLESSNQMHLTQSREDAKSAEDLLGDLAALREESFQKNAEERINLVLLERERLARLFGSAFSEQGDADVYLQVFDAEGQMVCSTGTHACEALLSLPAGNAFPGWTVSLCPASDGFLDVAAKRQAMLYIWTGSLVILLFFTAGSAVAVMVARQVRLNRLKNDFIATVSHELKTPLASMRVLMDTLFEGHYKISPPVMEYLGMMSQDNLRLARMIDNFLSFSRMERNKQAFDFGAEAVKPMVNEAVEALRTKLQSEGCTFRLYLPAELPAVKADHDALVMVLINLLENAYKYSNAPREISLAVSSEESIVVFAVRDNGIGMSTRSTRRIFEKFYQVDQHLTRKVDGCGLGLSIVKFIVDAHRGTIEVESRLNEGSTFTVRIPRA